MTWLELAETQYQRYLDGEIDDCEWAQIATNLMENLLEMNKDALDRLRKL